MTDIDLKTITGRDKDLIVRALVWAIATIEEVPGAASAGDLEDTGGMRAILASMVDQKDTAEQWVDKKRLKIRDARNGRA